MASTFGWLDTDGDQRRRMLEVVDLFRESDTVDELGVAAIRDAFSHGLFPGTSVLHTRLRYVLFIAWAMQRAAGSGQPAQMAEAFERLEFQLIEALLAGGESQGVIGNRSRRSLQRLPSSAYWTALRTWGLRGDGSADLFFRRQHARRVLTEQTVATDDPGAGEPLPKTGLDPFLPPAPPDWMRRTDFTLRPEEAEYLSDRIASHTRGSMLGWLVRHPPTHLPDQVWDLDHLQEAPDPLRQLVDHAWRFQLLIHGANLVYNLLLARQSGREELIDRYQTALVDWQDELGATDVLRDWDRSQWWSTVREHHSRISPGTVAFFDDWLSVLGSGPTRLTPGGEAELLIAHRERRVKGTRARLANQAALDQWNGGTGLGRHTFRWNVARSHLHDLYAARAAS